MGDSLDLGRLADNLPSSSGRGARAMQAAEADLQSAFRNSALCITQMLKAGQKASKRSYQAGYSTALQDVLEYLQSSLDVNVAQQRSNEGIAQVIDYIEARQEAVRLELQDLEADEDQPQHTASPRTQPIINGYQASTSSQFFRSHPHHRQHQEHQQQPVSVYRQQQQPSYQPVASTSGSSGPSAAALNARKPRPSSARSSSPVVSRTSSSISNTLVQQRQPQQQQQYHDNAISRPSSSTSVSHRRITDINDAERTQESIPLASSSSIPNSPEARFSPDIALPPAVEVLSTENRSSSTVDSTPPPSISAVDTPLSNTSTAVSPLTRLQAKRERERHHDRRSRTHGLDTTNGGQSSSAAVAAGVKRRWTAALLPEHHTINLSMNLGNTVVEGMQDGEASEGEDVDEDDEASDFSGQGVQQPSTGQRKSSTTNLNVAPPQEDDMGMETDDTSYRIDGNARPIKRTARR